MKKTREDLMALLARLDITCQVLDHAPVYTVEESNSLLGHLPGGHSKNLFLKDKKGNLFLVTALDDRPVDMKDLRIRIGAKGNLSFGRAELLGDVLGVEPGSVTPFALINDPEKTVHFFIDKGFQEKDPLNFHPLTNAATLTVDLPGLQAFLAETGHGCTWLDFDAPLADVPGADIPGNS